MRAEGKTSRILAVVGPCTEPWGDDREAGHLQPVEAVEGEEEEGGGEEEAVHEHPEHPGGQAPPREDPGGLREAIQRFFFCFFMVFFKKGGWGGLGRSKSFESLFFALKQSKANKCQCAKRLKTVKKIFLKFFV